MYPDDAKRLHDSAREGAAYHLRVELNRIRVPLAEDCAPSAGTAVIEGTVTEVYRSPRAGRDIAVGEALTCRVEPCVPAGHPELMPTSPCIAAEVLENAAVVEVFLDDQLTAHQAAIEIIEQRAKGSAC